MTAYTYFMLLYTYKFSYKNSGKLAQKVSEAVPLLSNLHVPFTIVNHLYNVTALVLDVDCCIWCSKENIWQLVTALSPTKKRLKCIV